MKKETRHEPCGSGGCSGTSQPNNDKLKSLVEDPALAERLSRVKHKIMVLSGKGGVGKSTVAVNMAVALALEGRNVGLLDVDFHGPSIPTLLHLEDRQLQFSEKDVIPVAYTENLRVVSLGFLLRKPDEAVIWRGPMKMGVIKQLLTDVQWGNLDYLVIDFPPGTGDEPLSVAQLIPDADGAVIVTTPQDLSLRDVRKSINFCKTLHVPVLGVIENMSGLVCPTCKTVIDVFKRGGGEKMARDMGVPFLGRIPMDPSIVESADSGRPFVDDHGESEAASAFRRAVAPLLALETQRSVSLKQKSGKEESMQTVKIALPVAGGRVCAHFGHCETFALLEVDRGNKVILNREDIPAPPHEPGLLPQWLHEKGADIILAGGMGSRAKELFAENRIQVVVGVSSDTPEAIVQAFLDGRLSTGANVCDH